MDSFYQRTEPLIKEYCAGHRDHKASWDCEFLVSGTQRDTCFEYVPNQKMKDVLDSRADIYRSLWSRRGSLFFLDLEYKNAHDEDLIYRQGQKLFQTSIEPVYQELCSRLEFYNISFITVMTATGYHLVFAVPFASSAHTRLAALGQPCPQLQAQYARVYPVSHRHRPVPDHSARGFEGMGRLAEFLAKGLSPTSDIPTDIGIHKDQQIVLDLSTYADPLHLRFLRCVGSYHQKSRIKLFATMIRRTDHGQEYPLELLTELIGEPDRAADYMSSVPAIIPEAGPGLHELLTAYEHSALYLRHNEFDLHIPREEETGPAGELLQTYTDAELASDSGFKRFMQHGTREGIHPRSLGTMAAERLKLGSYDSPIMAWATEDEDGYNPYSRAFFWARLYTC